MNKSNPTIVALIIIVLLASVSVLPHSSLAQTQGPDLVVVNAWQTGSQIRYTVANKGLVNTSGSFYNALFIDGKLVAQDYITSSLAGGQQLERTFSYQHQAAPPSNTIRIIADYQQNIKEDDEQNNIWEAVWQVSENLPDLIVERLEVGEGNKLSVTIKNIGAGPLPVNWVAHAQIWINGQDKGVFSLQNPTFTINGGIAVSGGSATYLLPWDILESTLAACNVDVTNSIKEANEQNNYKEEKIIPSVVKLPDLVITEIKYDQKSGHVNCTIKNAGDGDASTSFVARLSLSDPFVYEGSEVQATLKAGETFTLYFKTTAQPSGQIITIQVCADTNNQIKESNEQNNCREEKFQLAAVEYPDLAVQEVFYDPKSLTISYTIKNIGAAPAPQGIGIVVMVNGQKTGEDIIPYSIKPGESYNSSFKLPSQPAGNELNIQVNVDPAGILFENNRDNNFSSQVFPIPSLLSPDLVITEVWVTANRVYYRMKNIGDGTAEGPSPGRAASAVVAPANALIINDARVSEDRFPLPLLPGDEIERSFEYILTISPSDTTIRVCADWRNNVTESIEDNNCRELGVNAPIPLNEEPCGCFENDQFPARITPHDGFAVGNVLGDSRSEIITAVDQDAGGDNGRFYIYDSAGHEIHVFDMPFTRNDRIAVGDVWGDSTLDEIVVASDERDTISIYNSSGMLLSIFHAPFAPYDCLAVGNVVDDARNEIIIASHEDDKIYVYRADGARILEAQLSWNFTGSWNIGAKNDAHNDGLAVGDVFNDGHDEIILARLYGNQSRVYIYSVDRLPGGDTAPTARRLGLTLKMHFPVRYTKYDGITTGDVLGDDKEEIIIAVDEDHGIYIYDAMGRWLKLRYAKVTPVDGLATGNVYRGPKEEIIIAVDEDLKVYIASEDP